MMTLRFLPGFFGSMLAFSAMGCILPDIHDNGPGGDGGGKTAGSGGSGGESPTTGTGGGSSSSGSGTPQSCTGNTLVGLRFANVAPAPGAVDFCLGTSGNLSGPVAKLAGAPGGIDFASFMNYDYLVEGPIDIRVIPAGGSCSGESLGDITGVCLTSPDPTASASVYFIAGETQSGSAIAVLPDEKQNPFSLKIRFFNTIQGTPSTDFGLTDGAALPTILSTAVASNIPFGQVPPPGNTILNVPVNEAGYLEITDMPNSISWGGWGVALSGETAASAVVPFSTVDNNMGVILTIVAAGKVGDPLYPVQFVGFSGGATPGMGTSTPEKTEDLGMTIN